MTPPVIALLLLASSPNASRSEAFTPPEGWVVVPEPDAERASCANWAPAGWVVSLRDGSVVMEERRERRPSDKLPAALASSPGLWPGRYRVLPVEGGFLVGSDRGEWGGRLTWFAPDGKTWRVLHQEKPVVALVRLERDAVLSFEGVNHLRIQPGTVRWLELQRGVWTTTKTLTLDEAPELVLAEENEAFLLGPASLMRMSFSGTVRTIQKHSMGLLGPTSMVRDATGAVWIGASHFVVRLTPRDEGQPYAVTWLARADCVRAKRDMSKISCVCVP